MDQEHASDGELLMERAVEAVDSGDHEQAMVSLKQLVAADPDNVMALYLLATVHASMGMHERAVSEMAQVVEQEPDFHVARFQLGLILLAHGQEADTMAVWEHYQGLGEEDCFYLFRRGIDHFMSKRLDESIRDLEASIESNEIYESVIEDMVGVLEEVRSRRDSPATG